MLNNTQQQQEIPIEQAEWSLLVDMEAGQACKRIREFKRKAPSKSVEVEFGCVAPRWRMLCERTGANVLGDYRSTRPLSLTLDQSPQQMCSAIPSLQNTWKAVLACANSYKQQLSDGPPLNLSTLAALCENANRLVPPEQVWPGGDPIVGEINTILDGFVDVVETARKLRAQWMDLWYKEGVELDVLRKSLKRAEPMMARPDEYDELYRQVKAVAEWQCRLDQLRTPSPSSASNDLQELEDLFNESDRTHGFRSRGVLDLKCKLQKAYDLRERILEWKKTIAQRQQTNDDDDTPLENMKFLAALVREINRLKLKFPAACFVLELSEIAEAWVERANIAIRSRISLTEIKSLIQKGKKIPLELSEHLEKLKAREKKAQEWLNRLTELVALPDSETMAPLDWMKLVRAKIYEGGNVVTLIHDLACEGSRIPVEMDCVKLLQIELDARNWCVKARSWIPNGHSVDSCKRGKLEDIREHLEKATLLRNGLVLSPRSNGSLTPNQS